jgi:hypothetical protein
MAKEFEKLIEKRKDWVRSSKENKFDFDSILAGLYNDPSHFIYEILQNAEDEGAKEVRFELFEDRLDVYHNGKDFDLEDIDGVTGIGISKKKDDLTSIGKFGVGFKSVFAVTETPYIFSGEYRIKIEDFVIPSVVASNNEQVNGTLIRLPFNHKLRSLKEVFTLIAIKLENIGLRTLLFLKNIEEIKWQTSSSSGHYLKSSGSFQVIPNARRVVILSSSVTEEYIVIGKPIKIEGKDLIVEVAYKLGKDKNDKEIIVQEPDTKLVVFFPTEKVTFLNFIIQGPYKTTPNRENIPLEDEQNKSIIEETGNLVAESLSVIKDLGYLDTYFLSFLPINPEHKENEQIYSVIYDKVKEKLLLEELLPTSDGKYTKAGDALLARGKELTEILDKNDIQELFSKKNWLDTNITYDKTRKLRDYLIDELNIVEVDFESFVRKLTETFLQTKSDEWMIDFYIRLLDQQSLWSDRGYSKGILRTKPIIRLQTNEHIAPFDDKGEVQAYLSAETKSEYKTVKSILTENENSLKFLKELGLTKPDLFAEIKEFILLKYQIDNPVKDERYYEDFEKLLTAYETIPANKKREFTEELSTASFIDSVNNGTGENHLLKPSETYFNDRDLRDYFNGYDSVYFASNELYEKFRKERLKPFLIDLGIEDKPRRIEIDGNLSWEEKSKLRGNIGHTRDNHQKDYEYEGLDNVIKQITVNMSYLLWKLLLINIEGLSSWRAREFFEGEYSWFYRTEHNRNFDAKFMKTLRQQAWLIDNNNNFMKSSDITFTELSNSYIKESSNIDVLLKVLEFKPDIIDQLPEEYRNKLELVKDISIEDLEKLLAGQKKKELSKPEEKISDWNPEYKPGEVDIKIEEIEPDKIMTPDLKGQSEELEKGRSEELQDKEEDNIGKDVSEKLSQADKKGIGEHGEMEVYLALRKEYQGKGAITETDFGFKVINQGNEELEIVWLNKHHNTGKGYDFVVKKTGIEIEYIEVKTKVQEAEELIEVTGTQWEFARKLHEQGEGEKYSLYVVINAGKSNVGIKRLRNPIKLWKDGKLYAHPINFKI